MSLCPHEQRKPIWQQIRIVRVDVGLHRGAAESRLAAGLDALSLGPARQHPVDGLSMPGVPVSGFLPPQGLAMPFPLCQDERQ